jgi:hypothetical protein
MKSKLIPIGLALTLASVARAGYQPVPLTPSSFNADVVVEKTAAPPIENFVTAGGDGGTNLTGNAWFETGYYPSVPGWGLPPRGTTFAAQYLPTGVLGPDTNFVFTMAPDYTTNNVLFVSGNNGPRTATLTINNPAAFVGLSLLESSGNGGETINYTVHHQDGSTETNSFVSPDWFHGIGSAPYPAWNPHCLVSVEGGNLQQINGNNGDLYHNEIIVTATSPVTSIDFALVGNGGRMSLFAISGSADGVAYTNSLSLSGFNKDVVVETNAPNFSMNAGFCNATMERGTNKWGKVFYETGFGGQASTSGLPPAGTTVTNTPGNHAFTLAPSYATNNTMLIAGNGYGPNGGTFTLTAPTAYQSISILAGSTFGPKFIDVTVHHADATTELFTGVSIPDWFNTGGTIAPGNNNGWGAVLSLLANNGFEVDNSTFGTFNVSNYRLFGVDVPLSNTGSPVTSVDFALNPDLNPLNSASYVVFVFGLAGSTGATTPAFLPAPVVGYNADMVVEATAPLHPNRIIATTASMDGGLANTGNTWYEQGYYRQFPATGLPQAGSTIFSIAQTNNSYLMPASYTAANAAYIDTNHPTANLTLANPATYTALSILSSDANGLVTNRCIMQYADGTSDTNTFVSQDWFNVNPYAFSTLGRVNLDNPAINNDPGHTGTANPRLYEAQFGLNNTTSPLTNILLSFTGAASANGRMVVFSVSGATGPYPPILRAITQSTNTTFEGATLTLNQATAGGSLPIVYNWQVLSNGVWMNLSDGIAGVSGSSTLTATIVTYPGWLTNIGNTIGSACSFRLQASNSQAVVVGNTATVTLLSGYPDLPAVGDPVTAFGGTTGDAGPPGNIDHLVGTSPDVKCLWHSPTTSPVNVGFTTTPSVGSSIARAIRLYTANDTQGRDPTSVVVDGSNDGGTTWVNILPQQTVALSATRNAQNPSVAPNPFTQQFQEFNFYGNNAAYTSYRVTFPTVNTVTLGLVQIGEVEILGQSLNTAPPTISAQTPATAKVFVGTSPKFTVVAGGAPILHYQWFSNNVAVAGATTPTFTLSNAQLGHSGNQFYCNVQNVNGTTNSIVTTLTVIPRPTQAYPAAVLGDNPIAFYRLDEGPDDNAGNNGVVANDYVGGFFGTYTNVALVLPGYNPSTDPDKAVSFGSFSVDSMVDNIGLDFSKPAGQSAVFSVEAWVQAAGAQGTDAGIVTIGYGGFEQLNLDCGGADPAHNFRFYVRDATGVLHGPSGTKSTADGLWHHLVGVCDEAKSNVVLYVDGIQDGITAGFNSGLGILGRTTPLTIGSRRQNTTTDYNYQFQGTIDDVAFYNSALTPAQVLAHYYAAQPAPLFTLQPTNTTVGEGATLRLFSRAYGPGTLSYQWYNSPDGVNWTALAGQTSSNLTIANISASLNGYFFEVVATNANGSATSYNSLAGTVGAQVTVVSGPPAIASGGDLPSSQVVVAGSILTLQVTAFGTPTLTYQWQASSDNGATWNNLVNNGRINGVTTSTLTIANVQTSDALGYRVAILNSLSAGNPTLSSMDAITVDSVVSFSTNGTGWQIQGTIPPYIVGNVLTITDNGQSENGSAYLQTPVNITGPFQVSFTYQVLGGIAGAEADGVCFVMHNDPRGPSVLSGGGGTFGIAGVNPSAELEFNIYPPANGGEGIAFNINGNLGNYGTAVNTPTAPVVLDTGHHINVVFTYAAGIGRVTLTDAETQATFNTTINLTALGTDLPTLVGGNTAYVGFSGADGGVASYQQISNFRFISIAGLGVSQASPGFITLTWPPQVGNYVLQSATDLAAGNWQTVNNPSLTLVNGQYQVTVPVGGGNKYYRLSLVP